MALGAMRFFREQGIRVPEDMAVVGMDDIDHAAHAVPALTTVSLLAAERGRMAAELLMERLTTESAGPPQQVRVLPRLVVRESRCLQSGGGTRDIYSSLKEMRAIMGTYKLLICDIDGTLMNQENPISVETKKALRGLSKRGVGVTLATGRNLWEAQDIVKDLRITLPVVLANGAQIYDFSKEQLLFGKDLDCDDVYEFLREKVPLSALVSWHDGTQWEHGSVKELLFHSPGVVMKRLLIILPPGRRLEDHEESLFWVFWDGIPNLKSQNVLKGMVLFNY